jgi:hypothetical protein
LPFGQRKRGIEKSNGILGNKNLTESQRETKKIVAKKKQQSKNYKQEFFCVYFRFFLCNDSHNQKEKIGDKETGQF